MSLTKQQMSKWLKDLNVLRVCKYQDEISNKCQQKLLYITFFVETSFSYQMQNLFIASRSFKYSKLLKIP